MKKTFLTANIWLKLASIFLAVTLWFFVMSSGRTVIIKEIPVQYVNVPQSLEIFGIARNVTIAIEGPKRLLIGLNQDDISVLVDLENMKAGKHLYPLSKKNVKIPKRLSITSFSPQTLNLTLEKKLNKEVSVKPFVIGSPEEGVTVESITITPDKVFIEGPKSLIRSTVTLNTEPIDISGIYENMQILSSLDITPNIKASIREVRVDIIVRKNQ